jgi:DNA-binding MarR family transcriptional regulator
MKLEDEIKQSKFKDEYHKLAVNIFYTYGWLMNNNASLLKTYGLTPAQYNILRILRGQHPRAASINLLKERMLDKMSDASRLVERLRSKGLLERSQCSKDRRQVDVVITEAGLDLLAILDTEENKIEEILKTLSPEEADTVNNLLDKLRG